MTTNWVPENWMGSLDETKLLSEFTIPGTHETCCLHGGPNTQCQNLKLSDQLIAGIRAIDIRCRHFKDAFPIHHGAVYQELNFTDVLNECKAFLDSHSTECIVMFVKNECTGEIGSCKDEENTRSSFEDTFDWYLEQDNNKDFFFYSGSNLGDTIPQLKDVRKKIVLLRRFPATRLPKGIDVTAWEDNKTFPISVPNGTLKIQDEYNLTSLFPNDIDRKWNSIKNLLDEARNNSSKDNWFINFSSGSGGAFPRDVAARINHQVSDYVDDKSLTQVRLGTIVTDFPDDEGKTDLVNRIIGVNFR